jgi:hypothetical protein
MITIPGATKIRPAQESTGSMNFTFSNSELDEIANASEIYYF